MFSFNFSFTRIQFWKTIIKFIFIRKFSLRDCIGILGNFKYYPVIVFLQRYLHS